MKVKLKSLGHENSVCIILLFGKTNNSCSPWWKRLEQDRHKWKWRKFVMICCLASANITLSSINQYILPVPTSKWWRPDKLSNLATQFQFQFPQPLLTIVNNNNMI